MDYVSDAVAPAVGPVVDKADNSGLVDGFTKSFGCIFRKLMSPTEWITSVMNPARLAKRGQKSAASGTTPGAAITDLLLGECMDDSFDKTKLPNVGEMHTLLGSRKSYSRGSQQLSALLSSLPCTFSRPGPSTSSSTRYYLSIILIRRGRKCILIRRGKGALYS